MTQIAPQPQIRIADQYQYHQKGGDDIINTTNTNMMNYDTDTDIDTNYIR